MLAIRRVLLLWWQRAVPGEMLLAVAVPALALRALGAWAFAEASPGTSISFAWTFAHLGLEPRRIF